MWHVQGPGAPCWAEILQMRCYHISKVLPLSSIYNAKNLCNTSSARIHFHHDSMTANMMFVCLFIDWMWSALTWSTGKLQLQMSSSVTSNIYGEGLGGAQQSYQSITDSTDCRFRDFLLTGVTGSKVPCPHSTVASTVPLCWLLVFQATFKPRWNWPTNELS